MATYLNDSDDAYSYSYDDNGNIVQTWRSTGEFSSASEKYSYVYDNANQLICENLCYGPNDPNNKTVRYYDDWNKIIQKKLITK